MISFGSRAEMLADGGYLRFGIRDACLCFDGGEMAKPVIGAFEMLNQAKYSAKTARK